MSILNSIQVTVTKNTQIFSPDSTSEIARFFSMMTNVWIKEERKPAMSLDHVMIVMSYEQAEYNQLFQRSQLFGQSGMRKIRLGKTEEEFN